MALHGYLVDEITHDFGDGILTRREALRRLGMLGLSVTGADALLAACADDDGVDDAATTPTTVTTPAADGPPGKATAVEAKAITFGSLQGTYAEARSPKGAVLVMHENRGLTPHFFDVPDRLAGVGYSALAVDLLSRQGGTAKVGDEAAAQAALGKAALPDLLADLRAGIDELEKRASGQKIGAVGVGVCFGGWCGTC